MATWKKVIVSGSNAHLAQITSSVLTNENLVIAGVGGALQDSGITVSSNILDVGSNSITSTGQNTVLTGSFSGSFTGNATLDLPDLTQGTGITAFTYDGTSTTTIAVSGAAALTTNGISKWSGDAFVDSSLSDDGSVVSGASSIVLTGAASSLTGSFTGSFIGDGSGLTGLVTELNVSGSDGSGISIDLLTQDLTIGGTANEIETSVAGTTVTIGLPDDVVIGQDLTVTRDATISRNLTVLGTASFQHTEDLAIADRFILLASGSNAAGDGGIVIQQDTQDQGEVFGFDAVTTRWAVTGSFDASQNVFTPDAFMATVVEGAGADPTAAAARYTAKGNIFVGNDENIWIYS
jgi:hypothetical protein